MIAAEPSKLTPDIALAVASLVAVEALPVSVAVIVPAEKWPEPSLATIVDPAFAFVAVVAELLTFPTVAIVASFVSAIAALAFTSSLTIAPEVIAADNVFLRHR